MTAAVTNSLSVAALFNTNAAQSLGFTGTAGRTMLIFVAEDAGNTVTGVTDSASNTYVKDYDNPVVGTYGRTSWRCTNFTGSPTTFTVQAPSAVQVFATVLEVTGLATSSPLGQTAVSATDTVSFTTTTDNELAFVNIAWDSNPGASFTSPGGYTQFTHTVYKRDAAYALDLGTAGANTATFTSLATPFLFAVTYKAPAGGGGPTVSTVSSNSATEGSSIVHTVTLSAAVTGSAASYAITLAGGTATGGGTDYTSTLTNGMFSDSVTVSGGNISVPVGVSTFTVTVSTAGDTIDEANETYTLTIGGTAGTGTINDDDAAPVITVGDAPSVTAGSPAIFTISLDRAKSTSITVDAACVDGTLVGGVGYTSNLASAMISNGVTFGAGALTIPAGVTSFTVSIPTAA